MERRSSVEGDRAGASTFDCYDPRDQICGLTADEYEPQREVMIKAEDFAQRMRVTVPQNGMEKLHEVCRRDGLRAGLGT